MSVANIIVCFTNESEEEVEIFLPAKYEVCSRCLGVGTHVNPNIDGHGITESEWANEWDEESKEMYLSGYYDVTCYECNGLRVVLEIDEEEVNNYGSTEQRSALKQYHDNLQEENDYRRMVAAEIAFGC